LANTTNVASPHAFNVYYDTSTTDSYACGAVGYCEIGPGVVGTSGLAGPDPINPVVSFSLVAVPEPSTWAMLTLGFASLGFVAFRRTGKSGFAVAS
jgi:hypothetical protein